MDPASPTARLLALAAHWASRRAPRRAAWAYLAAAASTGAALPPSARAGALIAAAQQLLRAAGVRGARGGGEDGGGGGSARGAGCNDPDDGDALVDSARAALAKACLLLDGCPGLAVARLHAASLLETACARAGVRARQVVADALEVVRARREEIPGHWDWWIYWTGRLVDVLLRDAAIASASATATAAAAAADAATDAGATTRGSNSTSTISIADTAATIATATIEAMRVIEQACAKCVQMRDHYAAGAFRLMEAQIYLRDAPAAAAAAAATAPIGAPGERKPTVSDCAAAALDSANKHIDEASACTDANPADTTMLRAVSLLLKAMLKLRDGRISEARALQRPLVSAFEAAGQASRGSADGPGQWKWQSSRVLRTLVQHVLSASSRNDARMVEAWRHSADALKWAGLPVDSEEALAELDSGKVAFEGKLPDQVGTALAIVLLDDAARIKLAMTDLAGAGRLVSGMLARVHPPRLGGLPLATQASVYLLAGEYYMMQGTQTSAEIAANYLHRVTSSASLSSESFSLLGDIAQMAETYLSLLTGEKRFSRSSSSSPWQKGTGTALAGPDVLPSCTSVHVCTAALFADGLHELRGVRVVEAKQALESARALISDDGDCTHGQLKTSIITALVSLYMSSQMAAHEACELMDTELMPAMNGVDLINSVRILRIKSKLLSRTEPGCKRLQVIELERSEAESQLAMRQSLAPPLDNKFSGTTA